MLCISGATLLTPATRIEDGVVVVENGRIAAAGRRGEVAIPEHVETIDGQGLALAPGFIDLQLNGAFGHDFTHDPGSVWEAARKLPRYGVTAFLPTIISSPAGVVRDAQAVLRDGPPAGFAGAQPIGLHLEGPFINRAKKGAHNEAYIRPPEFDDIADWSPSSGVRLVTLAPEVPEAYWFVGTLAERGIVVSAGHSLASYEEAREGIDAGISYATHLFNAMPPLHHREPGLAGAVLADERVTIGLIADGVHVHPSLVKVVWQIAGDNRLNLVTDAMAGMGMPPGSYRLGDLEVTVGEDTCRLDDGTLAGCIVPLDACLRNLMAYTGCDSGDALRTVASTPAALLRERKGLIAAGYDADLVLLDEEFQVVATIAGGRVVYWRG
jgi:N-acetylglucosamine-6-phosphate deacetylase